MAHYVLELGFDLDEIARNAEGNRVLHHFLYNAQGQQLSELIFAKGDRLSFHLFDLTDGADENAVACEDNHPVTNGQTLSYVFEPWSRADPPGRDNPFAGHNGHLIGQTEALFCTPSLGHSKTADWWGPTLRHRAEAFLDLYLDQTFVLENDRVERDIYAFSMRLELRNKVWSFDPQMIVDGGALPHDCD